MKQIVAMTRDELRTEAARLGIQGRGSMNKQQLLDAIFLHAAKTQVVTPGDVHKPKTKAKKAAAPKAQVPDPIDTATKINNFAWVLDSSGSMVDLRAAALRAINANIETVKQECKSSGQIATATLTLFGSKTRSVYKGIPIGVAPVLLPGEYRCDGLTALFDAVGATVADLEAFSGSKDDNVSNILIVITDGYENNSRTFNALTLKQLMQMKQATDRWSFVYLLPAGGSYKHDFMRKFPGVPEGNIAEWTTTSAGMNQAEVAINTGIKEFFEQRSKGALKITRFFTTDLTNVSKADIERSLIDLSPQVREASVDRDVDVRQFCIGRFGGFSKGGLFYELTKAETVQSYKKILISEKQGSKIYGGVQARNLLGLPSSNVRVHPGNHANYQIYVQSTSVNRKLLKGTKVMYAPGV